MSLVKGRNRWRINDDLKARIKADLQNSRERPFCQAMERIAATNQVSLSTVYRIHRESAQ